MRVYAYIALFFVLAPGIAFARSIPSFEVRITAYENATIEVAEYIEYDFGTEEDQHGIFRNIPYSYQAGITTYTADIRSVEVRDQFGNSRPFNESRGNGELTLKIGDPDKTVTGTHIYVISYTVEGPFLYFDEYDELYWNVTGAWQDPIGHATVLVDLPRGASVLQAACYQGAAGTHRSCDSDERLVNEVQAGYSATADDLAPQEGFSVSIAFPKGVVEKIDKPWSGESATPLYAFAAGALPVGMLFVLLYLWYTRGRDPEGRTTIVTQFEPPAGVPPSVAGIVYNEIIEQREITAEILQLAVEGYIRIHEIEKEGIFLTTHDFLIERVQPEKKPDDPTLSLILDLLFKATFEGKAEINGAEVRGVLLSKMQHAFADEKEAITNSMYEAVFDAGYFVERPDKVRQRYKGIGIGAAIAGVLILTVWGDALHTALALGAIASGLLTALWGFLMPAKTREGVLVKEHLEGFKRYLSIAEKDRIAFHNAPERTPEVFSKYLPYAIAFGVEEAWAEQFKGMFTDSPTWYVGAGSRTFSPSAFSHSMALFSSDFASASAPRSSGSGGGGSVGGGFGGGGGGSW